MNEQKSQNIFGTWTPSGLASHVLIPWTEQYNNVGLGILVFPFLDGTVRFSSAATVTAARLWGLIDNQWLTFFFLPLGSYFGILGFKFFLKKIKNNNYPSQEH